MQSRSFRVALVALPLVACAAQDQDPPPPTGNTSSAVAVAEAVSQGFGGVVTVAAPPAASDGMTGADALLSETTYSNEPGCVAMSWSGTTVTFVFTGCTMPGSGLPIDGTLALGVQFSPLRLSVAATELSIGATTFDGTAAVTLARGSGNLAADLETEREGVIRSFATDTTVTVASGVFTFDGSTTIGTPAIAATVDTAALRFAPPDCLPSGGTLTFYDDPGSAPIVVEFLPTTPGTGQVMVTVGGAPPVSVTIGRWCTQEL